jgi:hypothetical protein
MYERAEKPSISALERGEEHEREGLRGFLKRCRARIAPERASLGPYLRLPTRVGGGGPRRRISCDARAPFRDR